MNVAAVLFWIAAGLLAYTYVGYPLLAAARARLGHRPTVKRPLTPSISVLVVAHNEAERISRRVDNLLALDYPSELREIVIASDGSSDATVARAGAYRDRGVKVVAFERNRGKPAVLNELVPRLTGEIVVLMDVRQHIAPDALHRLLENFADPDVGAVSGELMLSEHESGGEGLEGVGFYWRYEKFIRLRESRIDSTVGATGALYALRRALFEPIPEETLLDDVLIPMHVVRQGYRVLFEPAARATEGLSPNPEAEFRRKVRTIAGNFQLLASHPWLLDPKRNRIWFATLSHKACRLLGPLLLLAVLAANAFLLDSAFYVLALLLQLGFYFLALLASRAPGLVERSPLFSVPHAFCLLNAATVVGFYRFLRGQQQVTWSRPENHGRA